MFYETFARLCQQKGKSPNAVAKAVGVKSTGTVSAWKKGAIPNDGKLLAIADYFKVTVDYLLGIDPASYADSTKYNLSKLEAEYAEEKDPDRKAELSGQIDILKESLADQAIASAFGATSDYLLGATDDPTLQANDSIKTAQAALFGGLYGRLSEQEMDNLWADVQEFAQFKATQMIRGKGNK